MRFNLPFWSKGRAYQALEREEYDANHQHRQTFKLASVSQLCMVATPIVLVLTAAFLGYALGKNTPGGMEQDWFGRSSSEYNSQNWISINKHLSPSRYYQSYLQV